MRWICSSLVHAAQWCYGGSAMRIYDIADTYMLFVVAHRKDPPQLRNHPERVSPIQVRVSEKASCDCLNVYDMLLGSPSSVKLR